MKYIKHVYKCYICYATVVCMSEIVFQRIIVWHVIHLTWLTFARLLVLIQTIIYIFNFTSRESQGEQVSMDTN